MGQPFFLLDNDLNPAIAKALALVGYNILSIQDEFGVDPQDSVLDPDIISRCARKCATWITADIAARRKHEAQIKSELISVVWVNLPKSGLSAKQQLKAIVKFIDRIEDWLREHPKDVIHWKIGTNENARLEEVWRGRRPRE